MRFMPIGHLESHLLEIALDQSGCRDTTVLYVAEADLYLVEATKGGSRWRVRLDGGEVRLRGASEVARRLSGEELHDAWIERLGDA